MTNRPERLSNSLVKRAISVNSKLQKLSYEYYLNSACSDINALSDIRFLLTRAKPYFEFLEETKLLIKLILENGK